MTPISLTVMTPSAPDTSSVSPSTTETTDHNATSPTDGDADVGGGALGSTVSAAGSGSGALGDTVGRSIGLVPVLDRGAAAGSAHPAMPIIATVAATAATTSRPDEIERRPPMSRLWRSRPAG